MYQEFQIIKSSNLDGKEKRSILENHSEKKDSKQAPNVLSLDNEKLETK